VRCPPDLVVHALHALSQCSCSDHSLTKWRRSKWLPLFSDVTAIIYCVSSSDYDLVLEEDGVTNRMIDSLELFKTVRCTRGHLPSVRLRNAHRIVCGGRLVCRSPSTG
jgi:hypothetical protein